MDNRSFCGGFPFLQHPVYPLRDHRRVPNATRSPAHGCTFMLEEVCQNLDNEKNSEEFFKVGAGQYQAPANLFSGKSHGKIVQEK